MNKIIYLTFSVILTFIFSGCVANKSFEITKKDIGVFQLTIESKNKENNETISINKYPNLTMINKQKTQFNNFIEKEYIAGIVKNQQEDKIITDTYKEGFKLESIFVSEQNILSIMFDYFENDGMFKQQNKEEIVYTPKFKKISFNQNIVLEPGEEKIIHRQTYKKVNEEETETIFIIKRINNLKEENNLNKLF